MLVEFTYLLQLKGSSGDGLFADDARDDELYLPSDGFGDTELGGVAV